MLSGATGPNGAFINGTYIYTTEMLNGKPVYAKESTFHWIFFRTDGKWGAGATTKEKDENSSFAGWCNSEAGAWHPAAASIWTVWDGVKWELQPMKASKLVPLESA